MEDIVNTQIQAQSSSININLNVLSMQHAHFQHLNINSLYFAHWSTFLPLFETALPVENVTKAFNDRVVRSERGTF